MGKKGRWKFIFYGFLYDHNKSYDSESKTSSKKEQKIKSIFGIYDDINFLPRRGPGGAER